MKKQQKNIRLLWTLGGIFALVMVMAAATALAIGSPTPEIGLEGSTEQSEDIPATAQPASTTPPPITDDATIAEPVSYNKPAQMRAVYLTPGVDFLTSNPISEDKIKQEIDTAIQNAKELSMNTVIIDTSTADSVLYKTDNIPQTSEAFDIMEYTVSKARENSLYVYAIYDALLAYDGVALSHPGAVTGEVIDNSAAALLDLASYNIDGVLVSSYYNQSTEHSYSDYLRAGGAIGYENYMTQVPDNLIEYLSQSMRSGARGVQFGVLTDPVWMNQAQNEAGSATNATFTTLGSGNADVKGYVENKWVDFVAVDAYGAIADPAIPFEVVTNWWSDLCSRNAMDLYVVQSSERISTNYTGWSSPDELAKQLSMLKEMVGYSGSAFDSLSRLVANPQGATDTLLQVFDDEINPDFLFTELTVSRPAQATFSTEERNVTFSGGSDPTNPVTINGEEIETDDTGFFTVAYELEAGQNTFTIAHKEKSLTYVVTRTVTVLKEIDPTGNITVDGGMDITISAMAYDGASVSASINGRTVTMTKSTVDDDDIDKESSYVKYTGTYTAPTATSSVQNLGQISVTASYEGSTMTLGGAYVKVNEMANIADGDPVVVTASQAETFPTSRLDDISDPSCYPLAKGVLDYTVGSQIVYKDGSTTYTYYNLASGQRVYAGDVQSTSQRAQNNTISGLKVDSDSRYTTLTLFTEQLVSYDLSYSSSAISIEFQNTSDVPDNLSLNKNPLFSSANWSGSTLKLTLRDGFLGYKAYTDGGNIVFRFNNPPAMSGGGLGGAYIVVDSGHGTREPGAVSFPGMTEADINEAISEKLVSALKSMGASVIMVGADASYMDERVADAESYNANLYISVHSNAATASAAGSEAFYFRSWSSGLASQVSSGMAKAISTNNRGGKYGLYYVTRVSQYPSILAETGFITNEAEYKKLCTSSYQTKIANNIAVAIESYFLSQGGGTVITGTQSVGSTDVVAATGVTLDKTTLALTVGGESTLKATVAPTGASQSVTWKSSDTSVATVDTAGTVKAVKAGTATITVTTADGKRTATCAVTVTEGIAVSLDKTTLSLQTGGTAKLTATVTPTTTADKTVTWKSSDEDVIAVDTNGNVTAVGKGSATITATSNVDTTKSATCSVTVTEATIAVTGVTLDRTILTMTVGGEDTLVPTVVPDQATTKAVTWDSSNSGIVTVDQNGKIKAIAAGSATIKVTTTDGAKTATCVVTVESGNVAVAEVSLNTASHAMTVGETFALTATISPDNATNKNVTWQSDNEAVATVDSTGNVTAIAEGTANITVTTEDAGKTAVCAVTVGAALDPPPTT